MNARTTKSRAALAAGSVLALVLMAGCGDGQIEQGGGEEGASPAAGGTLAEIQESGTVTVGIAGEAPYSFQEGGEATGATIAMHEKIFSGLGVENVEAKLVDWDALIPGLNAGRFDVVSAGMSILPERCEQAAFSDPEIMYTTALMVQEGNPKNLTDLDSIVAAEEGGEDIKLAVLSGGIEAGYADKLGLDPQSVGNAQDGMDTVAAGRADAFAMTAISLNWLAEKNPDAGVEVTEPFVQVIDGVEQIGAGATVFRQGDTELLEAYNSELAKITESEETYVDVVGDFGFTAENLPPKDLTTEQLCSGDLG
ncbi:ectoine/hydroxyectoine ABC transporter substrate-binding protein EhuB [Arthrobacter sp. VKM Ac-2550]|uniref:ectoine/hydroxyectoine ABC transporter substrate-binding protein EhuB n=1 Tax=Crystallibacter permensis TaxID=1938888 RepID=UPI0022267D4E|nr:ectoine/hydroxyectoine ABC transporter substrate-binding protein EhuB [Arthrobacter sp. VKM Ac-2550]MCW2130933.1 amino acid ABC transporter substrate-binding protein, PAAT family [Arthrobacter sp. VKM Ac-2550]